MKLDSLTLKEELAILAALRHSISLAALYCQDSAPWIHQTWRETAEESFALYQKLGGKCTKEELNHPPNPSGKSQGG